MRVSLLFTAACLSSAIQANPVEKRDSSPSTSESTSKPTAALVQTTISGKATTVDVSVPTTTAEDGKPTDSSSPTTSSSTTSTGGPLPASSYFPQCNKPTTGPFCLPENSTTVYIGDTYYVTWDPASFTANSSITVILQYLNNTNTQAWSSERIPNEIGYATITMKKEFLGSSINTSNNLTFVASEFDSAADKKASFFDGPNILLTNKPVEHLQPPPPTKVPNKLGLLVGLPVSLGFCALVVFGLCLGMRKQRMIGLGNIMSRRRGYVSRKSRRQRLGMKKGNIRLEEREMYPGQEYRDEDEISPAPVRNFSHSPAIRIDKSHAGDDVSLGSLVSEDENGTRQQRAGNAFRQEINKQQAAGKGY
ncbi:hypothetical protein NA57DRAFT_75438 [Rhizodiscina lignyota]|uniref:Mid2 domain-containing protein n=1 Tax=Rhizodiscina lignyota TaxID=1504668 RepID=A0A9P4IDP1_9PEZI|nr:hypothetical protein NA57DRAFT_75438 [Rhizodiscina lignyota]